MEGVQADDYIAWTPLMKKELMAYQEIPAQKIFVGGIPVFEVYHAPNGVMTKDELCARYGLDPQRKIIVYGTISPKDWHPYDLLVVEFILQLINQQQCAAPAQLLVRFHPRHHLTPGADMKAYAVLKDKYPHLWFSVPKILSTKLTLDMPAQEFAEVASLVRHAAVLVNVWSTLNLEAALCDTPVINIAFDPVPQVNAHKAALIEQRPDRMMSRPHIKRLLQSGGVAAAHSWTELAELINRYLEHPEYEQAGRRQLAEQEGGFLDANCGERIANHVLNILQRTEMA
jgi:hypothetical protein